MTETPTWDFIENLLATRYPPYTLEKMKKMQKLTGNVKPPFTRAEGSADRAEGVSGWIYATGITLIGGLAGILYKQNQSTKL